MPTSKCRLVVKTPASEVKLGGSHLIHASFNKGLQYPVSKSVPCKVKIMMLFSL